MHRAQANYMFLAAAQTFWRRSTEATDPVLLQTWLDAALTLQNIPWRTRKATRADYAYVTARTPTSCDDPMALALP